MRMRLLRRLLRHEDEEWTPAAYARNRIVSAAHPMTYRPAKRSTHTTHSHCYYVSIFLCMHIDIIRHCM
jgi:hypothetical protein